MQNQSTEHDIPSGAVVRLSGGEPRAEAGMIRGGAHEGDSFPMHDDAEQGGSFAEENLRAFGQELRRRRKERGWNGVTFATMIGKSPQYLSHMEKAYSTETRKPVSPGVRTLEAISAVLTWDMMDIWRVLGAVSPSGAEGRTRRTGMWEKLRDAIDDMGPLPDEWKEGPIELFRLSVSLFVRQLEIHDKQVAALREQAERAGPAPRPKDDRSKDLPPAQP